MTTFERLMLQALTFIIRYIMEGKPKNIDEVEDIEAWLKEVRGL